MYEGGGNSPAVAVPLVALGTQSGTIDVIDVSANAVAASFSVHNGIVRGLRWLGNSRLVSFSYVQVYADLLNFLIAFYVFLVASVTIASLPALLIKVRLNSNFDEFRSMTKVVVTQINLS